MARVETLIPLLETYVPADDAEAANHTRMLALARGEADPFDRTRYEPGHFTASAFVLSPQRDALLMIYSTKFERWLQPGGHIDPEDGDAYEAAIRETHEETGLANPLPCRRGLWKGNHHPLFDIDIHTIPANPARGEPGHEHFDLRFLLLAPTLDLEPATDARDARWFAFDQIDRAMSDMSVLRAIGKMR